MRISDWSSDVCSSDLHKLKARNQHWRRRHSDQDERHSTQDKNCGQIQKAFNQHGANQHADGDSELTMEPDHTKAIPRPQWKNVAYAKAGDERTNAGSHRQWPVGSCLQHDPVADRDRKSEEHTSELQSQMRT